MISAKVQIHFRLIFDISLREIVTYEVVDYLINHEEESTMRMRQNNKLTNFSYYSTTLYTFYPG